MHIDWLQGFVREVHVNGLVVALFIALMALNSLREVGSGDSGAASIFATRTAEETPARRRAVQYTIGAALLCVPFLMSPLHLREAEIIPALAVIFVSLVAVTGYSGQISLGQVGFAGLGALFYAKFAQGDLFGLHSLPGLVSLLGGMIVAGIVGFATGYPAIRRRGLFLALTTFAVGAVVSRFVFNDPFFTSGVQVNRPSVLGWSLNGEAAFYAFELGCLALVLLVVRNLRSGRLGRALVAMRDSEAGARSVGIDIGVLKIFIFAASSALAGLGGALLALSQRSFEPTTFDPLQGLFWFTAVVVFGADSAAGAVIAAAVVVTLDTVFVPNSSTVLIGVLALMLGRMPGGVVEGVRRLTERLVTPTGLIESWESSLTLAPPPPRRLSAAGRAALARVRK